jgi:hypothetical protein
MFRKKYDFIISNFEDLRIIANVNTISREMYKCSLKTMKEPLTHLKVRGSCFMLYEKDSKHMTKQA